MTKMIYGVGTLLLMIGFIMLVIWVYTPSRRKTIEQHGQIPFDGNEPLDNVAKETNDE